MATLEDIALDDNGNFITDADGDAVIITDVAVIIQDLADELMTYLGMLFSHLDFGGRVQMFIKAERTPANTIAIGQEIATVLMRHPNVVTGTVRVIQNGMKNGEAFYEARFSMTLNGKVIESTGPLVIILSPEGVRVLES